MANTYESKTMDIEGKAYTPVHERIKEFYSKYPLGSIQNRVISGVERIQKGDVLVVQSLAFRYPNDPLPGIGHSQATHGEDYFKTSALEIAETSAIGRALGSMGIGIKGVMASGDEVEKSNEQRAAQDKEKKAPKEKTVNSSGVTSDSPDDKKVPDYSKLKEPEKSSAESIAGTIKLSTTKKELVEISEQIKSMDFSNEALEELRKEKNQKVREINAKEIK
jgi:hypothetical protein